MAKYVMNVSRNGQPGLLVRVPGQPEKLFRPHEFDSPEAYTEAAEAHAARLVQSPVPLPVQRRPKAGSKSGVAGVRLKNISGRPYWMAEWPSPTGPKRRVFSVLKYGYEEALRLAILTREMHTKPMSQAAASHPNTPPTQATTRP